MKRYKVEFTIIFEEGGEPEHIVREHDVMIYINNEGEYAAIVFAPSTGGRFPAEVCAFSYAAYEEVRRRIERYLRQDAVDLIHGRVRVGEVSNG
jgi:hypothetical protein